MAYVDYSAQFVLDQFFTYINANQLGSNDKHIVDHFSVEHNWDIATADGTHKWEAITVKSSGSQAIAVNNYWTPTAGLYQMVGNDNCSLELYISAAWVGFAIGLSSLCFFDGTNMRIRRYNADGYVYYQKF